MKTGDAIVIRMPRSEETKHPDYYRAFHGKHATVHKLWDFSGALYKPLKGDETSVEVKIIYADKSVQFVHIPISYCERKAA